MSATDRPLRYTRMVSPRPLTTYYVVPLAYELQRDLIYQGLVGVAQNLLPGEQVNFLVTPAMAGQYTGYLPSTMWPIINERTR
jgi:hypothetical protein